MRFAVSKVILTIVYDKKRQRQFTSLLKFTYTLSEKVFITLEITKT